MAINPYNYMANRAGIPRIQATGVTVGTASVQYTFDAREYFARDYSGLVLVRVNAAIPAGTTTTLPIVFTSSAGEQAVTAYNGAAVTVANVAGTGIWLMYYDREAGTLQMLTGYLPTT